MQTPEEFAWEVLASDDFVLTPHEVLTDLIRARDAEVRAERRNFRSVPEGMVWQDYYSPDEVMQIREQVRAEVMREMSDHLRAHAPKTDITAFMRQQP